MKKHHLTFLHANTRKVLLGSAKKRSLEVMLPTSLEKGDIIVLSVRDLYHATPKANYYDVYKVVFRVASDPVLTKRKGRESLAVKLVPVKGQKITRSVI